MKRNTILLSHTHTLAVPRDSEEPPGLSNASCFPYMAQKQRRGGGRRATSRQVSKRKGKKEGREGGRARKWNRRRKNKKKQLTYRHISEGGHFPTFEWRAMGIFFSFTEHVGQECVCCCLHLSVCRCVSARAVLRIDTATRQPLCSSEHMVSDTSLSSAILSVYTA